MRTLLAALVAVITATAAILVSAAPATAEPACAAGGVRRVDVADAAELTAALAGALPGDHIVLADGVYVGRFVLSVPGLPGAPIVLCGTRDAVLDGGAWQFGNAVLWLKTGAALIELDGFTVRNGKKGVMFDDVVGTTVTNLDVHTIGEEAIHLRGQSSFNEIRGSAIHDTGLLNAHFGEGVYVGQYHENWQCVPSNQQCLTRLPSLAEGNIIEGNEFWNVKAEAVDTKEGTVNGIIRGNTFDGSGHAVSTEAWVDIKGSGWLVEGNVGTTSRKHGFMTTAQLDGGGNANVFTANIANLNGGSGYGFRVTEHAIVRCDNVVTGAASGYSNRDCVDI